jgi:hypothetical protein
MAFGGPLTLREAILQVPAGMKPDLSYINLLTEVSGDSKIGLEKAVYILQRVAEQR